MAENFNEMPAAERERELWEASQKYLHGKIGVDEFEGVEDPYIKDFKKASLRSNREQPLEKLTAGILIVSFTGIIIAGLLAFVYLKDRLTLIIPAILFYLLIRLLSPNSSFSARRLLDNFVDHSKER